MVSLNFKRCNSILAAAVPNDVTYALIAKLALRVVGVMRIINVRQFRQQIVIYIAAISLIVVGCIGRIGVAYALTGDESKPVQITADSATLNDKEMVTNFMGNVVITRGTLVVHANNGEARQDAFNQRIVTLYGSPVYFEQMLDDGAKIIGQGDQFTYNTKTNLAVLVGRARIQKGKNTVVGNKITYNSKSQIYSVTGTHANGVSDVQAGRITVILEQDKIHKANTLSNRKNSLSK